MALSREVPSSEAIDAFKDESGTRFLPSEHVTRRGRGVDCLLVICVDVAPLTLPSRANVEVENLGAFVNMPFPKASLEVSLWNIRVTKVEFVRAGDVGHGNCLCGQICSERGSVICDVGDTINQVSIS